MKCRSFRVQLQIQNIRQGAAGPSPPGQPGTRGRGGVPPGPSGSLRGHGRRRPTSLLSVALRWPEVKAKPPPRSRRSPSPLVARGPRLIKRQKAAAKIWSFPGNVDRNFGINQDNPHTQKSALGGVTLRLQGTLLGILPHGRAHALGLYLDSPWVADTGEVGLAEGRCDRRASGCGQGPGHGHDPTPARASRPPSASGEPRWLSGALC